MSVTTGRARSMMSVSMRALSLLEKYATMITLVVIVSLVVTQITTRYILPNPPLWTEEFARYGLVWLTFLGAAWLSSTNEHLTVHALDLALRPRGKIVIDILAHAVQATVAVVVVMNAPAFLARVSQQTSAAGGLSMAWVYGSATVGFALMLLHSLHLLVRDVLALPSGQLPSHIEEEPSVEEAEL